MKKESPSPSPSPSFKIENCTFNSNVSNSERYLAVEKIAEALKANADALKANAEALDSLADSLSLDKSAASSTGLLIQNA